MMPKCSHVGRITEEDIWARRCWPDSANRPTSVCVLASYWGRGGGWGREAGGAEEQERFPFPRARKFTRV